MSSTEKEYTGGCHCGYLRYSIIVDLTNPVGERCNCSSCLNRGVLILDITPPSNFTLQSPASRDGFQLGKYSPRGGSLHFYFCKTCGVNCFYQGGGAVDGKDLEYVRINALTLDPDQGLDFSKWKLKYWDGKNNNWKAGPSDVPYPGGCV
jgi:hypothetical protein